MNSIDLTDDQIRAIQKLISDVGKDNLIDAINRIAKKLPIHSLANGIHKIEKEDSMINSVDTNKTNNQDEIFSDDANNNLTKDGGLSITDLLVDGENDSDEPLVVLMRSEQTDVARKIKTFLLANNISQREVVAATKIKQSHLSQHLSRGTPMAQTRRESLYEWFIKRKTDILDAHQSCGCIMDPPKKRKRGGFKWPPGHRKILEEAFLANANPDQASRTELARKCNSLEKIGGSGFCKHRHRVTQLQIYNWFANKRRSERPTSTSSSMETS